FINFLKWLLYEYIEKSACLCSVLYDEEKGEGADNTCLPLSKSRKKATNLNVAIRRKNRYRCVRKRSKYNYCRTYSFSFINIIYILCIHQTIVKVLHFALNLRKHPFSKLIMLNQHFFLVSFIISISSKMFIFRKTVINLVNFYFLISVNFNGMLSTQEEGKNHNYLRLGWRLALQSSLFIRLLFFVRDVNLLLVRCRRFTMRKIAPSSVREVAPYYNT
ncbi:hypothetical protein L9F63_022176, partial [Diploptera punctata]